MHASCPGTPDETLSVPARVDRGEYGRICVTVDRPGGINALCTVGEVWAKITAIHNPTNRVRIIDIAHPDVVRIVRGGAVSGCVDLDITISGTDDSRRYAASVDPCELCDALHALGMARPSRSVFAIPRDLCKPPTDAELREILRRALVRLDRHHREDTGIAVGSVSIAGVYPMWTADMEPRVPRVFTFRVNARARTRAERVARSAAAAAAEAAAAAATPVAPLLCGEPEIHKSLIIDLLDTQSALRLASTSRLWRTRVAGRLARTATPRLGYALLRIDECNSTAYALAGALRCFGAHLAPDSNVSFEQVWDRLRYESLRAFMAAKPRSVTVRGHEGVEPWLAAPMKRVGVRRRWHEMTR
jgi:hypothetical protein